MKFKNLYVKLHGNSNLHLHLFQSISKDFDVKICSLKLSWDRILKYEWRHIWREMEAQNWFVECSLWVPSFNGSVYSYFSWFALPRKLFRILYGNDIISIETYPIYNNVSEYQTDQEKTVEVWKRVTKIVSLVGELVGWH